MRPGREQEIIKKYKMFGRYRAYALHHKKRRIRKKYSKKLQKIYQVEDGIYCTMNPIDGDMRQLFAGGYLKYSSPTMGYLWDMPRLYSGAGNWYVGNVRALR